MRNKKHLLAGAMLIELLVVITIIAALASLFAIAKWSRGQGALVWLGTLSWQLTWRLVNCIDELIQ